MTTPKDFFSEWEIEHTGGNVYIATRTTPVGFSVLTDEVLSIYKDRDAFDNSDEPLSRTYFY